MRGLYGLILFLLFSGCSSVSLREVSYEYYQGDPNKAFDLSLKGAKNKTDALLFEMMGGMIGFDLSLPRSFALLERAEEQININEKQGMLTDLLEGIGAIAVNESIIPYKGYLYEGVMVNYYKALFLMKEGDLANARVEFNRANDRQRRLKAYYQTQIQKAIQLQDKNPQQFSFSEERVLRDYQNLKKFEAFQGYINPVVSYLSGLFFMLERDPKGIDLLKEAYGISRISLIQEDFLMAQRGMNGEKYTWVVIEDGMSARKIQKSFVIPVVTYDGIFDIAFALPDWTKGNEIERSYHLWLSQSVSQAQRIGNLDPLIFNEFSKHLPFLLTRAITSSTLRALSQYWIQKTTSGLTKMLFAMGGMAYDIATTQADLRSNQILPHSFWVARLKNQEGILKLQGDLGVYFELKMGEECVSEAELCLNKNNIIYFRNAGKNSFYQIILRH